MRGKALYRSSPLATVLLAGFCFVRDGMSPCRESSPRPPGPKAKAFGLREQSTLKGAGLSGRFSVLRPLSLKLQLQPIVAVALVDADWRLLSGSTCGRMERDFDYRLSSAQV
jgi:hypothetical protein